ncbi:GNAT family N-acetyltransferase [Pseudosporangium ferrugineum]|uniref:Acetyltransferase (GNAT) family protein n=1 Tax=Pseudosporangium ferrugineum TaxID=439699 RepID=A0A2T0RSH4_9ACTN|nr:GNAT family N-acetyltransferase [Pseudosporangium ferrugineum]PRY24077.1 acetyltransferase (GNAT) family protein [Pseudosporangium ferrugineum]
MLIEARPATDPELGALLVAQQRELADADGGRDGEVYPLHDGVAYLVVIVGGRAVACGAWQALGPGAAELKRMYVRPAYRGRGIARQLIVALEEEALAADRPVLRLETGTYLPAAIALYRSAGYTPIPAYGEYAGNPYSVCFEKSLAVTSR